MGSLTGAVALTLTIAPRLARGRIWLYAGTSGESDSTNLLVKICSVQTISREGLDFSRNPQRLNARP